MFLTGQNCLFQTLLLSATRRSNFTRTRDACVKFERRVADSNECYWSVSVTVTVVVLVLVLLLVLLC